ncbi:hypothetical protein MKX33_19100 [Paenibacillus sp. FSL R5-0490]|uniref:hypothetical protein n=1 Tax=Paenibacillus sp. FSL R5-0490 TaxID=1920424 RepID=UPI0030D210D8
MTLSIEDNQESRIFIGARDLGVQVYKILPTFDLILNQIEQIRSEAKDVAVDSGNMEKMYLNKKEMNHTMGIFGTRGTGKTSVLYTIKNRLRDNEDECIIYKVSRNIILPIIEPDHFGDNTTILGSIVGLLKKEVEKQLHIIKNKVKSGFENDNEYFNKGCYRTNNPLQNSLNEVIEYHMYTSSEYRKILIHHYDDLATHIKKSSHLLTPDVEFKYRLHQLISTLIENQRRLIQKDKSNDEPLIFLFIDDIDLKMKRSRELIEALLLYANHPNVITILSGDYDILKESIMLALIQDEQLKESNLTVEFEVKPGLTLHSRKLDLADEYLKKIIPPMRRHQLIRWNENTIPEFAFGTMTLSSQLNELLGSGNIFNYTTDNNIASKPIRKSYSIFDQTPRGIVNVYYRIYELIKSRHLDNISIKEEGNERNKQDEFNHVKSLIDTIIISSKTLVAKQKEILEDFLQWGNDATSSYLNYSILESITKKFQSKLNQSGSLSTSLESKEEFSLYLQLMIIGDLIQKLLPEVRIDENDYNRVLNVCFNLFLKIDKDSSSSNKLREVCRTIINNNDFRNNLLFIDLISDNEKFLLAINESKYKILYSDEKFLLETLNKLVNKNNKSTLFQELFYRQYSSRKSEEAEEIKDFFDFIQKISSKTAEHDYYKTIYKPILPKRASLNARYEIAENQYLVIIDLFINMLMVYNHLSQSNSNSSIHIDEIAWQKGNRDKNLKKEYQLFYFFMNARKRNLDFKRLNLNQKNKIQNLMLDFEDTLERKIFESNDSKIKWIDSDIIELELEKFMNGADGENTTYKKVKKNVQWLLFDQIENTSLPNYIETFNTVLDLSRNYHVWYGRKEAMDLIKVFREQSYLNLDHLEKEIWILIKSFKYLQEINSEDSIDYDFQKVKNEINDKLDIAFERAKNLTEEDLNVIGFDLEDDEEMESQGSY